MIDEFVNLFIGMDLRVPVLDGSLRRYINLDNAASTPPFKAVLSAVERFMPYYSSVHRGTGFKSQLSTHAYEQARLDVLRFVGANPADHTCIFGKNTTEAINKLAHRFPFQEGRNVVLVSTMEHHSNDLPWRSVAKVVHVRVSPEGRLEEEDFDAQLARYAGRVALVAISGASNVTGFINPVHRLAEKAHAAGAQIAVDCAQLAPHRKIDMRPAGDPAGLDYVALSAHKLYAPFGTGALVGRKEIFEEGVPDYAGGGEVEIVTLEDVVWSEAPERDEAGSPNTVGAIAFSAAIRQLEAVGMGRIAAHEAELTAAILPKLKKIDGIRIFGDQEPGRASERLGVVPVNLPGLSHYLVAAILGYEFGIGVRNGCFCAHPYLLQLMEVNEDEAAKIRSEIVGRDRRRVPGMARISFGLYNSLADIDAVVEALEKVQRGEYKGHYRQEVASGAFVPQGWQVKFEDYFTTG